MNENVRKLPGGQPDNSIESVSNPSRIDLEIEIVSELISYLSSRNLLYPYDKMFQNYTKY